MSEIERRKAVILEQRTDIERWANPAQLEAAWAPRALIAADFILAGSRVLDIGCGEMVLERYLPFGCSYVPCDVLRRDDRTIVTDLNAGSFPEETAAAADVVVMLGVWEYLFRPEETFAALAKSGKPVVCSYCTRERTTHLDRRALGWVNDFSLEEFIALARQNGYAVSAQRPVDSVQYLFKLTKTPRTPSARLRRVHVISYNNVGNFGDRLGYHLINDVLPADVELSWGTLRPFAGVPAGVDLLIVGIGNSLFGDLIDEPLIEAAGKARASIGIFGTQYRTSLPGNRLRQLLDRLQHWYARYEEDVQLYGRNRDNVSHLGDWLINAFPMTRGTNEKILAIGQEIWKDLPLDRTIQSIQQHRRVFSKRLHPLLCALTSAETVAYKEQRESGNPDVVSGKFRSMLLDVFGRTYPESDEFTVDRDHVIAYKTRVRQNSDRLRQDLARMLT